MWRQNRCHQVSTNSSLVLRERAYRRIESDLIGGFEHDRFGCRRTDHACAQTFHCRIVAIAFFQLSRKIVIHAAGLFVLPCVPSEIEGKVCGRYHRKRATNQVNVEMKAPERMLGSTWFLDADALVQ
jgi:hypothetical protein